MRRVELALAQYGPLGTAEVTALLIDHIDPRKAIRRYSTWGGNMELPVRLQIEQGARTLIATVISQLRSDGRAKLVSGTPKTHGENRPMYAATPKVSGGKR